MEEENKNQNQNQNFQVDYLQKEEEEDIFDVEEEIGEEWEKEITISPSEKNQDRNLKGSSKEADEEDKKNPFLERKKALQEMFGMSLEDKKTEETDMPSSAKEEQNSQEEPNADTLSQRETDEEKEMNKLILSGGKLDMARQLLKNILTNSEKLFELLGGDSVPQGVSEEEISREQEPNFEQSEDESGNKIVEGVFDGENMIGSDGQKYTVPMNYASKSKLVEGDILKLTITSNGSFIYKQIQPIERERMVGTLIKTKDGEYVAEADDRRWKLLDAAVTYFKGELGDEVIFFIPKDGKSKWAAVENIIKK